MKLDMSKMTQKWSDFVQKCLNIFQDSVANLLYLHIYVRISYITW